MSKKFRFALACAAAMIGLAGTAHAAPVSWTVVSSASSISLAIPQAKVTLTSSSSILSGVVGTSLTASYRVGNPGTASGTAGASIWTIGNKQFVDGSFVTDTDFSSSIQFLSTAINGIDSGNYAPLVGGDPGTAPGDFGARIYANTTPVIFVNLSTNIDLAIRDAMYTLASGAIPLTGGGTGFNATGLNFGIDDGLTFDYRARNGSGLYDITALIGSGHAESDAIAAANTSAGGTISYVGPNATMTIPINIPISIPLDDGGLLVLKGTVTGTIVATAVVPEPATFALLGMGVAMLVPMAIRRHKARKAS